MSDECYSYTMLPEDESPEHYLRGLPPEEVARKCSEIRSELAKGNEWAWCTVMVYATCPECGATHGEQGIGRTFEGKVDFLGSDTYALLREDAAAGIEHKSGCSRA